MQKELPSSYETLPSNTLNFQSHAVLQYLFSFLILNSSSWTTQELNMTQKGNLRKKQNHREQGEVAKNEYRELEKGY